MVRATSAEAYEDRLTSGKHGSDTQAIEQYVLDHGPVTRRMVSEALRIDTATVSGIVTPLVKTGMLVEVEEKAPCKVTGRNAFYLEHKYSRGQM